MSKEDAMSENVEKKAMKTQELAPEELDGVSGGTSYSLNEEVIKSCDKCGRDTTWKCIVEEWSSTTFRCESCKARYRYHNMFGWFPPVDKITFDNGSDLPDN